MLEEVKQYLRIDGIEEDIEIQSLIDAAEEYLSNSGAVKNQTNPLYKLAVKMLVSNWYENREPIGKAEKLAFSLESLISQLKYCYSEVKT